jgi:FecR protein
MLHRVFYPQITQTVFRICVICGLLWLNVPIASGQRVEKVESFEGFMTGIRANAVNGQVFYQRNGGTFALESSMRLEQGDFIRSGAGASAELLLQPGNYLRLGGETECNLFSDQHDKMRLKLSHGSLIVELLSRETEYYARYLWAEANELIRVITPDAEVFINRPGVVRINIIAGHTEVVVREGEAVMNGYRIKKSKRAVTASGNVSVTEIETKVEDNFDTWSRERATQLVQENKLLKKVAPWAKSIKRGDVDVEVPDEEENDNLRGRVISARPGTVNFVEDGVWFSHDAKEWLPLDEKTQLETGDRVRTTTNSFAELILFPDMHFRIDASSEVKFDELSNDSISLKVVRGSAILDVARFDRKLVPEIMIGGSSTSAVVNETGNYRIDARDEGNTITVRDGKVLFNQRSVGSCKTISGAVVSECDKKPKDNFDYWSQHRGEGEMYNGEATVAMVNELARLRQYRYKSAGFWYQQPGQTSCTFVPFTSPIFRSPYGGSYTTALAPRGSINRIDGDSSNPRRRRPEVMRPRPER